jgi:hypothetical protein
LLWQQCGAELGEAERTGVAAVLTLVANSRNPHSHAGGGLGKSEGSGISGQFATSVSIFEKSYAKTDRKQALAYIAG